MTLEKLDDSARAFIRGAWPLCLIAMLSLLFMPFICNPYMIFSILYGFAGCLIFVRGFGLATFWPIYGLTLAAFLAGFPSSNEMTQVEHIFWNIEIYLWAFIIAFKSALMALPFSLFFFERMGGYVALLKIPLCVFFLVLVLDPTILILLIAIFGM